MNSDSLVLEFFLLRGHNYLHGFYLPYLCHEGERLLAFDSSTSKWRAKEDEKEVSQFINMIPNS